MKSWHLFIRIFFLWLKLHKELKYAISVNPYINYGKLILFISDPLYHTWGNLIVNYFVYFYCCYSIYFVLARAIRKKKEIKRFRIGNEELKMLILADNVMFYMEKPMHSTKTPLELINQFSSKNSITFGKAESCNVFRHVLDNFDRLISHLKWILV